jgi:hypothetical protein
MLVIGQQSRLHVTHPEYLGSSPAECWVDADDAERSLALSRFFFTYSIP